MFIIKAIRSFFQWIKKTIFGDSTSPANVPSVAIGSGSSTRTAQSQFSQSASHPSIAVVADPAAQLVSVSPPASAQVQRHIVPAAPTFAISYQAAREKAKLQNKIKQLAGRIITLLKGKPFFNDLPFYFKNADRLISVSTGDKRLDFCLQQRYKNHDCSEIINLYTELVGPNYLGHTAYQKDIKARKVEAEQCATAALKDEFAYVDDLNRRSGFALSILR